MSNNIEKQLELHQSSLEALALYLTKESESAKDLYQETVFRIWMNRHGFVPGTNFKAWSQTIMSNLFRSIYRTSQRRRELLSKAGALNYMYSADRSSQNQGEWLVFTGEVEACLDSLEEKYRTPLRMQYEGYPYEEITEKIGLPLNTLKSCIHKGRKKMNQLMRQHNSINK